MISRDNWKQRRNSSSKREKKKSVARTLPSFSFSQEGEEEEGGWKGEIFYSLSVLFVRNSCIRNVLRKSSSLCGSVARLVTECSSSGKMKTKMARHRMAVDFFLPHRNQFQSHQLPASLSRTLVLSPPILFTAAPAPAANNNFLLLLLIGDM